jgi:hypothetical protein
MLTHNILSKQDHHTVFQSTPKRRYRRCSFSIVTFQHPLWVCWRAGRSHGPLGKDSTTEFSYRNSFVATRSLLDPEPRAWRFEDVRVWGMEKERAARCATVDACVGDVGMSVNDDRNLLRSRRRSVSLVRTIGISRASSISCAVVRGG